MHIPLSRKIILLMASTFLTLLVFEVSLRAVFKARGRDIRAYQPSTVYNLAHADRSRFVSHPFLPYSARPGDSRTLYVYREETNRTYDYRYALNALGFRTPERSFEKPSGVKRIITLGGSTTVDGFTNAETWPARLESRLNERYRSKGIAVEVINLGLDMGSSPMSLINLEFVGLNYHPDLVITYDGINDSWFIGRENVAPDYRNVYRKFDDNYRSWQALTPSWAFHSYLVTCTTFALDRGGRGGSDIGSQVMEFAQLKESSDPLAALELFERNLKLMRAASRENNARFIAATAHWATPSPKAIAMNEELRKFFAREGMDYLDLDSMLAHDDWSLHVDQAHWTREGIERAAAAWEEKIVKDNLLGVD
jgi:hypothetical protein